jgi:hypothetical protein
MICTRQLGESIMTQVVIYRTQKSMHTDREIIYQDRVLGKSREDETSNRP